MTKKGRPSATIPSSNTLTIAGWEQSLRTWASRINACFQASFSGESGLNTLMANKTPLFGPVVASTTDTFPTPPEPAWRIGT
jgi:hypothetical protein